LIDGEDLTTVGVGEVDAADGGVDVGAEGVGDAGGLAAGGVEGGCEDGAVLVLGPDLLGEGVVGVEDGARGFGLGGGLRGVDGLAQEVAGGDLGLGRGAL
jgi:hypothetical protein